MKGTGLITAFLLTIINYGLLTAGDEYGLKVNVEHVTANVGDKPKFLCSTKKDAPYLIANPLKWVMIGRKKNAQPVKITSLANVENPFSDEFKINLINQNDGGMSFELTFKQGIKNSYDGYFSCQIGNDTNVFAEKRIEIHVIRMMSKMSFEFGNTKLEETGLAAYSIKKEEGTYRALCKAEQSNPAADVKIYLDNVEQSVTQTSIEDTSITDPPQAFNVQSVVSLTVTPLHKDKILKCVAMVNNDETMKREIIFKLEIFTVPPEIHCENKTVVKGQKFVDIKCMIKLRGIGCKDQIIFEDGNSGEQYKLDDKTSQYETSCIAKADMPNTVTAVFRINEVAAKDFTGSLFLIYVNKHGTTKREPIVINEDYNSASSIHYGIYLLFSMVVTCLIL